MTSKRICGRHGQAHDVTEPCPYCVPDEPVTQRVDYYRQQMLALQPTDRWGMVDFWFKNGHISLDHATELLTGEYGEE